MSSAAPKFASFRPKPKVISEQPPPEEPRRENKKHTRRRSSKERQPERKSPPREQRDKHRHDSSTKPYFSDRRGDHDIIKYGTPNRYDIPSYRRTGYGNVLGLSGQKIDREASTDTKIYMTPLVRQRQKRLLTDKHAAKDSTRTLRLVKVAENHQTDATRDFIALSSTAKRKRGLESDGEEDTTDVDYRRLDEKRDPNQVDDPDTHYDSGTEAASASSEVMQKNSRLIRETRDEPENLQAWLNLIEHQESMMKLDRAITELSAADRKNLADVRISTYEEALRKVGNDVPSQIELQVGLLRQAQQHWDDTKTSAKWQDVLSKHPHSIELWFGYLDFAQSTFSLFKYEDCRAAFLKALSALPSTESTDHEIAEARMHLLLRLTTMTHEAGYQELALAIWQAVLEYSVLAPAGLGTDKILQFEEFWESEAPRVGEQDSKGWRHTVIDDAVPPTCSITLEAPAGPVSSTEDFETRETEYISKLRYPGRSTDDVGEEDPFHTIFFSDLKDVITSLPEVSAGMHVDAFLCFCGLPPLAGIESKRSWRDDPYLQRSRYDTERDVESESDTPRFSEALAKYSRVPIADFHMTSDLLVQQTFSLQTSRLDPGFVRNSLKLLAANIPDSEYVGEYLLAFEGKYFPAEVSKTAKRLLKARPTSVRLYNMYGLVEDRLGNTTKAEQVFAAALKIKCSPADHLQLLSSYVWQALQQDNNAEALRRLIHSDNTPPGQPPTIESIRTTLQHTLETALLAHDLVSAIHTTSLLALLAYLPDPRTPTTAIQIHCNLTSWLTSHHLSLSTSAEHHAQSLTRLLTHHTQHVPSKPSLLRFALEPLITSFPGNTLLLAAYAANESRFAIDDRVRGNTKRVLSLGPEASVSTWAFAIWHEMSRGAVEGGTRHAVRAVFGAAMQSGGRAGRCAALWSEWMRFEIDVYREAKRSETKHSRAVKRIDGARRSDAAKRAEAAHHREKQRTQDVENAATRVRSTFYTGLQTLPWSKEFVMLAFTLGAEVFSREERGRLVGVLGEKEGRVYTEIEGEGG